MAALEESPNAGHVRVMRKVIAYLVIGLMFGAAFGFALGIFVYPFWFLRDVAMEQLSPAPREKLSFGTFRHATLPIRCTGAEAA